LLPTNDYIKGGAANFDWDHTVTDLCSVGPDENNHVSFSASINAAASDFVFTGRVYTLLGFDPAANSIPGGPTEFAGSVNNVGLKQGHPNGEAAQIVVELHLSFNSSGDINADVARAKSLLRSISITTYFSHPKA